jgi:hypothetical protein
LRKRRRRRPDSRHATSWRSRSASSAKATAARGVGWTSLSHARSARLAPRPRCRFCLWPPPALPYSAASLRSHSVRTAAKDLPSGMRILGAVIVHRVRAQSQTRWRSGLSATFEACRATSAHPHARRCTLGKDGRRACEDGYVSDEGKDDGLTQSDP